MRSTAHRRTLKKAKQFKSQCGGRPDVMICALGRKFHAWRREAVARANSLKARDRPCAGVWQLKPGCVRFIKALQLPPQVESEVLAELEELLRSSFSGILPHCTQQLHCGRRLRVRRILNRRAFYAGKK
jgi:hypothetical protein